MQANFLSNGTQWKYLNNKHFKSFIHQDLGKKRESVRKERREKMRQGVLDQKFEREYKKVNNYANRRTKIRCEYPNLQLT